MIDTTISQHEYPSGIGVLWSDRADTEAMCQSIIAAAQAKPLALVIIWFSAEKHNAAEIVSRLSKARKPIKYCGCSSSGEITPDGMQDNGFIVITLPQQWFRCETHVMDRVASMGMETIAQQTASARQSFLSTLPESASPGSMFALSLIDGMSYSEEQVTVAIDRGLEGLPLIGGSAGDDLRFKKTWQICQGTCHTEACVLTLIHCQLPCRVYTNNNFVPTEQKLVVTEADPDRRMVKELNAEPAALAYADAVGLHPSELNAGSFATYSVVVRFGGEYYCRSIQQRHEDDSLTFLCAIDNGLVLTVARSVGMVDSSRDQVEQLEADIGPVELMLGFDCIYRKLDAQHRQTTHKISALYKEKNFIGINTYGEQYGSLHVNQTFTGVAIGMPPDDTPENANKIATHDQ